MHHYPQQKYFLTRTMESLDEVITICRNGGFSWKKLISSKHHGNRNCWTIWIDTMDNTVYVEHHQGGGCEWDG